MMHIFAAIILHAVFASINCQTYKAGVVLYNVVESVDETPDEQLTKNVNNVISLINSNKDKADIYVVPEYGLTNIKAATQKTNDLEPYSTNIGNVNDVICKTDSKDNLDNLACAAKSNNAYIIVNLVEFAGKDTFYITNVGLDPNGAICLKCRKQHLSNGTSFTQATDQKTCHFNATIKNQLIKFAVLFGTDIPYLIPEEDKSGNVIITSSVVNNIPLNFGLSLYQGFAASNGVNLLVAGYSDIKNNYGGSGIFKGDGTSNVGFAPTGVPGSGTILLQELQVNPGFKLPVTIKSTVDGLTPTWNLQYMNIPGIAEVGKTVDKCLDTKCCTFKSEVDGDSIAPYKWIVLTNKTNILDKETDIFICALVVPSASYATKNFKKLSITSKVDNSVLTLPIVLNKNFLSTNFQYNNESQTTRSISLSQPDDVVIFGIVDILGTTTSGTNTVLIVIIVLLVLALIALLVGFFIWRSRQAKNRRSL